MPPIAVTFFEDAFAKTKREARLTLPQLAELIRMTSAPEKGRLPWLKFALFNDLPTEKDSLRWDGNVRAVAGLEADYDGEQIGVDEAVEILEKAGVYLDAILLPDELDEFFRGQKPRSDYIRGIVGQYVHEDASFNNFKDSGAMEIEKERPFFGEQMWVIFYVLRAVYGRCALLIARSLGTKQFQNWKEDKHLANVVGMVLPEQVMGAAKAMRVQGLQSIILHLNRAFLEEADKVLSGTKTTASLLPNYQAMLMEERDKITAYRQLPIE